MIERLGASRLMQYHRSSRLPAASGATPAIAPDRFLRTAPAAPDAALAEVRATLEGVIRVLNVLPASQLDALYQRFDLAGSAELAAATRELGVPQPQDANALMRLVNQLRSDQLDVLIRRFKLDENRDVQRYGPLIRSMPPEVSAGLIGMIKPKRKAPPPPPTDPAADARYVTALYRDLLGRAPDAEGFASHTRGLANGTSREALRRIFLESPEYQEKQSRPAPAAPPAPVAPPAPPALPSAALAPLPTVPVTPEFASAPIDRSSTEAALLSAATWVKRTYPQLFTQGDDRALAFRMMTKVIGVLRAHGYDAYRVVNHPSLPASNPVRYGSDALVLDGSVYDVYRSLGEANEPQVLNHGPMSPGQSKE